jgi:tetratricopeptide (TPR) repeat protein
MKMQELQKLLEQQKYNEALEGYQKIYSSTGNPIALYYITFIKFFYTNNYDIKEIYENFKILYNYNSRIRIIIYDFYLHFLIINEDYTTALKVSKKALKETKPSFSIALAYSKCLLKLNKRLDIALEYAKKSIEIDDSDNLKYLAYNNLIEIYCARNEYKLAKETLNKLYFVHPNPNDLLFIELNLAIHEKNNEEIEKLTNNCLSQNPFETLKALSQYYYETDQYELAIKYTSQLKDMASSKNFINYQLTLCYLYSEKYDAGINLLLDEPLDDQLLQCRLLADLYYQKGGKANCLISKQYYEKALALKKDENTLCCLGDVCFELTQRDNLLKVINELKKISKKGYDNYLKANYYRLTQNFDKAEKLIKKIKKSKEISDYKKNMIIENCSSSPETLYPYHNKCFEGNSKYDIRDCIKILIFGEYGNQISLEEASKYIDFAKKEENLYSCAYSTIATYYLLSNKDDVAYKYANIGHEKYLNKEDTCQCCSAIVAYCKLKGLGTEKNVQEAYEICQLVEEKELGDLNENIGHVYAECCILLRKDLNHIYETLEKTLYRRYSTSRYFMLVKIGKLLKKDTSKYQKLFKESLNHCSQREKEYYTKNQEDFLLNNY